jgi:hypothetical protein
VSIWKWQKTDCARVVVVEEVSRSTGGTFFALGAVISCHIYRRATGMWPEATSRTVDQRQGEN